MTNKKATVAGKGSTIDPKKPAYCTTSPYTPAERVNDGPRGGSKGKVTPGHGQTSDDMGVKNALVPQTLEMRDPYRAKGSDFPVKAVNAATGQSGARGTAEGYNDLVDYTENQCGTRHAEDNGPGEYGSGTPVSADRSARVAANFPIRQNDGEGSSDTGELGIDVMVDLETGYVGGGKPQTRVKEVPGPYISIGTAAQRNPKAGMQGRD